MANYLENIQILYHDNPPFSYRTKDNKIIGVEGNLINEFCSLYNLDYKIANSDYNQLLSVIPTAFYDLSLYRRINAASEIIIDFIRLNDVGASHCILVPRNIQASVRFSSPFSRIVNVLFLFSVVLVMIVWKVFKTLQRLKFGAVESLLEALKVLLSQGIDDRQWTRWSLKEKVLLIPFLYMILVLMGIYESHMVSYVISEHEMHSVRSIDELIKSETKIYEYFKELDRFDRQKVVNLVAFADVSLSTIPANFDINLAYFVSCRFGEEFMNSEENFIGDRRLFDMLIDDFRHLFYSTYLINENFPLKNEFKFMVKALDEAGIINHWTKDIVRQNFPQHTENEEQKPILLSALIVPVWIVVIGLLLGFLAFGFEVLVHKICNRRSNKVGDLEIEMKKVQKMRKEAVGLVQYKRRHSV